MHSISGPNSTHDLPIEGDALLDPPPYFEVNLAFYPVARAVRSCLDTKKTPALSHGHMSKDDFQADSSLQHAEPMAHDKHISDSRMERNGLIWVDTRL